MRDVQSQNDGNNIPIEQVGITGLRYPITVLDRERQRQNTIASISMSVSLPHMFKGTHMSRFIEVLNQHRGEITMFKLPSILQELRLKLNAESARIDITFPYFLERSAPVSKMKGLMDYECTFTGECDDRREDFLLSVKVPVTSLCPCSKEISDYGAHNQRGYISIQVRGARQSSDQDPAFIWIEELIDVAEGSCSSPVYPLLKREDERLITMQAYDRPMFVEDIVRSVAVALKGNQRVSWYRVHAVNYESIHHHNAFAQVSSHST
jgi:GTP cyclohydrolase I